MAIRALQQMYAATHPAAFLDKNKAPQHPAESSQPTADLMAALQRDVEDDLESG